MLIVLRHKKVLNVVKAMPLYEYECTECKTRFEAIVSLSSSQEVVCEKCQSSKVKKLVSAPGIHLGGSKSEVPTCQPRGGFS